MNTPSECTASQRQRRGIELLYINQLLILDSYLDARRNGLEDAAVMVCDLGDQWARDFTRAYISRFCPAALQQFAADCRSCPKGLSPVRIYTIPRAIAACSMCVRDTPEEAICSPAAPGLFHVVVLSDGGAQHAMLATTTRGTSGGE